VERKVFGDSKIYALTLNTPNLNSAGGSWVMHFADFEPSKPGELAAPVAIQEVDPGYPIELMRKNVQGTVMLSAVIFPDGTVGGVHVLRGLDDTLDQYACNALAKWKFQPATKNGNPVAVQTVVVIPFRPMRTKGF
jgi:TonB family protein